MWGTACVRCKQLSTTDPATSARREVAHIIFCYGRHAHASTTNA